MQKKILFILILSTLLSACYRGNREASPREIKSKGPVPSFVDRKSPMGVGVNAKTNQIFLIKTISGKTKTSCGEPNIDQDQIHSSALEQLQKNNNCQVKIIGGDEIKDLIAKTKEPIPVNILDGKNSKQGYLHWVGLIAYKGSYCSTHFVAGKQYEECVSQQELCDEYRKEDFPPSDGSLNDFLVDYPECKNLISK